MAKRLDFQGLKARVSVGDIIEHYGWEAKQKKDEWTLRCVFHDDTHASLHWSPDAFHCFGCNAKGGDIIDFVAAYEEVSLRQAALLIDGWFQEATETICETTGADKVAVGSTTTQETDAPSPQATEAQPLDQPTPAVNHPLEFTLSVDQTHPYLATRGLTPETIHEFGVGFCTSTRSMMKERIIIPIHDWHPDTGDADLVAYAGRWAAPEPPDADTPKYLLPKNFHKSAVVYNLLSAQRYAHEQGLVIVEGFFTAMRLWQVGIRTGVSLMGSQMSAQQEELIVQTAGACSGRVTLLLDPDEAGQACRDDVLARLCPQLHVRVVNIDTQPDELSDAELRAVVAGA